MIGAYRQGFLADHGGEILNWLNKVCKSLNLECLNETEWDRLQSILVASGVNAERIVDFLKEVRKGACGEEITIESFLIAELRDYLQYYSTALISGSQSVDEAVMLEKLQLLIGMQMVLPGNEKDAIAKLQDLLLHNPTMSDDDLVLLWLGDEEPANYAPNAAHSGNMAAGAPVSQYDGVVESKHGGADPSMEIPELYRTDRGSTQASGGTAGFGGGSEPFEGGWDSAAFLPSAAIPGLWQRAQALAKTVDDAVERGMVRTSGGASGAARGGYPDPDPFAATIDEKVDEILRAHGLGEENRQIVANLFRVNNTSAWSSQYWNIMISTVRQRQLEGRMV